METTVQGSDEPKTRQNRIRLFVGQFSWRMMLMRLVINSLTLMLVALLVPDIYFVDRSLLSVLLMAAMLGILNAFVKPIIQFLTLQFIFATYGFVVVLINTIILLLLDHIFDQRFYVGGLIWAIIGGLMMGIIASFLESLLGLNLPIVPKSELAEAGVRENAAGSRIISNMLSEEQPASSQDILETVESAAFPEPGVAEAAAADTSKESSGSPGDEEAPPAEEEDPGEALADVNDEQQGEER
jgi:putative membrane protein